MRVSRTCATTSLARPHISYVDVAYIFHMYYFKSILGEEATLAETSRDKFVRLAESRVNYLIKTIRLVGNLSNRSNYSYTEQDVDKMFRAIEKELKDARARFQSGRRPDDSVFKL